MTYGAVINDPLLKSKDRFKKAKQYGYRSGLEVKAATILQELGVEFQYEPEKISFIQPEKSRTYSPDFKIKGTFWETKGKWDVADRLKHKLIKEQHPDIRIVIIFANSKAKISKTSKTSYGDYATKIGVEWIDWKDFKQVLTREYL